MFCDIAIQAALANKIIARSTVKALRKDVPPTATAAPFGRPSRRVLGWTLPHPPAPYCSVRLGRIRNRPPVARIRDGSAKRVSRKRKLLEKQKEGKKRMKSIGSVDVPQEAFLAVLNMGSDS